MHMSEMACVLMNGPAARCWSALQEWRWNLANERNYDVWCASQGVNDCGNLLHVLELNRWRRDAAIRQEVPRGFSTSKTLGFTTLIGLRVA